jgi:hypothetical protein
MASEYRKRTCRCGHGMSIHRTMFKKAERHPIGTKFSSPCQILVADAKTTNQHPQSERLARLHDH